MVFLNLFLHLVLYAELVSKSFQEQPSSSIHCYCTLESLYIVYANVMGLVCEF